MEWDCGRACGKRHVSYAARSEDRSNRYVAHGDQEDHTFGCSALSSSLTWREPRLQDANLIVNDPKFRVGRRDFAGEFQRRVYSLKDFMPDLHVILTLETDGMKVMVPARAVSVMWTRMHGKGHVFYTAMGDRRRIGRMSFS